MHTLAEFDPFSLDFPLELAFLFRPLISFDVLGPFSPLGICSETEDSSLELAPDPDNLLSFLSEPGTKPLTGLISVRGCPEFLFSGGDPPCLRAGLLETRDSFPFPINVLLDLCPNSALFTPNGDVLPLKLRLPKQENLAALSAKPGSAERAGRGGGAGGNEVPKLGMFI